VDWSLLACGRYGHATYAPDEPSLREYLSSATPEGTAWRCLRCGTFVLGEPGGQGPASQAPAVRRGDEVRSSFILRIFAIERFFRALLFGAAAYAIWRFEFRRASIEQAFNRDLPVVRTLFRQLGYDIDHSKLVGLISRALTLSNGSIRLLAGALLAYVAIELVEGIGLWLGKRWGEYFAMIATSVFVPYEIYDLTEKITVTRVVFFAINLALVLYLVITKRLFGARGGKRAYQARLRSESIMAAAIARAAGAGGAGPAARAGAAPPAPGASSAAGSVPAAAPLTPAPLTHAPPATTPAVTGPPAAVPPAAAPPGAAPPADTEARST
jgi:uncharacterized membrane protein (DUF2068 family)